jgi:predicted ATPase
MPEYTFKHALVQDAAYGTLLRSRRQQLHARIAAVLEDRFQEIVAAQPALLAHHCTEKKRSTIGSPPGGTPGCVRRPRKRWRCSAAGWRWFPPCPGGDRSRETELDLQIALGQALSASRSWATQGAGEAYARARELASTLNRPRALLPALWGQWGNHATAADHEQARQFAAEIRDLGETSGDVPTRVMGYEACSYTCSARGEFTAARGYAENALALYDPAHRQFYAEVTPSDMLQMLLDRLVTPLACLGHLDQALSRADTAVAEARRLRHPLPLADALGFAWGIGWCMGSEPKSLLQCADELLALAVKHELTGLQAVGVLMRGWCLAALGRVGEGIPLLTGGLARVHEVGYMIHTPVWLTLLADACRMAGQRQAALGHLAEARRFAEETKERWALAEALRLRADVVSTMGDPAAAEAGYLEALALARQQSAKLLELRTATSLARVWHDQGKRIEARDLLAPVYGWFTEGFGTPVLQEAKALLEELAA